MGQSSRKIAGRNSAGKVVWRARFVLTTADAHRIDEIMLHAARSTPRVWGWQERYIEHGIDGRERSAKRRHTHFCPVCVSASAWP